MKLTFLGTSHGKAEKDRFCSSTVVTVNGKHYIIDAGAPIFDLFQRYDLAFEDVAGVFITHNHIDHIAGLPLFTASLNSPRRFYDISFNVYVPAIEPFHAMFELVRGSREIVGRIGYQQYEDGFVFADENVTVTSIPTKHCPNSHGFMIKAEGKSVVFTADLRPDMSDFPKIITETDVPHDLVVMEAAHQSYDKPYVRELLGKSRTKRMIIHHIAEIRNTKELVTAAIEGLPFPAEIAFDGLVTEV